MEFQSATTLCNVKSVMKSRKPEYGTKPGRYVSYQCINSLWSSDALWRHSSQSTLAEVMASCLTAPSHYLKQCRLIIKGILWPSEIWQEVLIHILGNRCSGTTFEDYYHISQETIDWSPESFMVHIISTFYMLNFRTHQYILAFLYTGTIQVT